MDSQLMLNGMLPPSKKFEQNVRADSNLSDSQKELLYQIVDNCRQEKGKFNIDAAFDMIAASFSDCFGKGKDLPFLIKQVIFCLTVNCLEYKKKSQKDVLDYLRSKGVSITHNFFTRLDRTPTMYLRDIPEHFINYMGQKHDELGAAIRNLVWQSGDYEIFYDLFGGSGAASIAVDKSPERYHVYNELNKSVYNLMRVVKDDKLCGYLVEGLKVLHNYLVNGGKQYGNMNLQAELQKAGKVAQNKTAQLADQSIIAAGLAQSKQARAYAYYAYFMELLDNPRIMPINRVDHAMAEIFRQFFATRNTDKSSVLSTLRTKPNRIDGFGNDEMLKKIGDIHQEFKEIEVENESFDIFLGKEHLPKNVLYYADPPYLETADYENKVNGVNEFAGEDMERLIKGLVDSEKHFIFSCRAVKGVERGDIDSPAVRKANLKHLQHMYIVFNQYIEDGKIDTFYILAVEGNSDQVFNGLQEGTLAMKIRESDFIELFITNFEITPFLIEKYPKYKFTVYDFAELSIALMSYMNV